MDSEGAAAARVPLSLQKNRITMRQPNNNDKRDGRKMKKASAVPSEILTAIWKKQSEFDDMMSSNLQVTKFLRACKSGDTTLALKLAQAVSGMNKPLKEKKNPFCAVKPSSNRNFIPKASKRGKPIQGISMGSMRGPTRADKLPHRSWRSGSVLLGRVPLQLNIYYLLIACRYNLVEIAAQLVAGCVTLLQTSENYSALYITCLFGSTDILHDVLGPLKPEVCESDSNGCTPLHLMILSKNTAAIELLLELGSDLLAEDNFGRLPIYYAYLTGDKKLTEYLWDGMSYLADTITQIDLSLCEMTFFPSDKVISRFQNLEILDISRNMLHYLPPALGYITSLTHLHIRNNPLSAFPPKFAESSVFEMKHYLRLLYDSRTDIPLRRVVVVGQQGVGKSALVRALSLLPSSVSGSRIGFKTIFSKPVTMSNIEVPVTLNSSENDTATSFALATSQGGSLPNIISISDTVKLSDGIESTPSACIFWETPGDIKTISPFLLHGEVLFVLVYNLEEIELTDLDCWMAVIKEARKVDSSCPIFLVGTHLDNPLCKEAHVSSVQETLRERYTMAQYKGLHTSHFFSVNATSSRSVSELRERISNIIQLPKYSDKMFPKLENQNWLLLREMLLRTPSKIIRKDTIHEYLEYCSIPVTEKEACIDFLQSTNNILNFEVTKKCQLLSLDIPYWLSIIQKIISLENPFIRAGIMHFQALSTYLTEISDELLDDILCVLEASHTVYRFRGDIIVPSLLPENKPAGIIKVWPSLLPMGEFECQRIYRYHQHANKLFYRLQQEVLYAPGVQEFTIWANGMLLRVGDQFILILHTLVHKTYQIMIHIRYPQDCAKVDMMLVICELLDDLIRSNYIYLLYDIERFIPCFHCLNLRSLTREPFLFPYDECINAVTEGTPFIFCSDIKSPSRCVRIDKLAPDIAFANIIQISPSQFTTGRLLGQGGFGSVYHGILNGKHEMAVKELLVSGSSGREKIESFGEFVREAYIMSFLNHPNLVSFFGVCVSSPPRLLMEYAPCGDLQCLIQSRDSKPLDIDFILRIALDIAVGMNHLHSISPPIIHRDLRSPNIFLMSLDKDAPIVAKIADFGLSRMKSSVLQETLSTYQWMAPETLGVGGKSVEYDEKADIYSYAIILWELLSLSFPFDEYLSVPRYTYTNPVGEVVFNCEAVKEAIEGEMLRPSLPQETPHELDILIRACWSHHPEDRPSFEEIAMQLSPSVNLGEQQMQISEIHRSLTEKQNEEGDLTPVKSKIRYKHHISVHSDDTYAPSKMVECDGRLWIACHNGTVNIYDISGEECSFISSWQAHVNAIYCMVVCYRSKRGYGRSGDIWIGGTDGMISIYPADAKESRQLKKKWAASKEKANSPLLAMEIIYTEVCHSIWCGELNNEISIWSKQSYEKLDVVLLPKGVCVYHITQHSNGMVWVGASDQMFIVDPISLQVMHTLPIHPNSQISSLIAVQDRMWSSARDGNICVWDEQFTLIATLSAHNSKIFCLCLDQNGGVWSGSFDKTIIVWDSNTFKPVEELAVHEDSIRSIVCTDKLVWSASMDNSLYSWEYVNNK